MCMSTRAQKKKGVVRGTDLEKRELAEVEMHNILFISKKLMLLE